MVQHYRSFMAHFTVDLENTAMTLLTLNFVEGRHILIMISYHFQLLPLLVDHPQDLILMLYVVIFIIPRIH
jgi:hypothetical protein